MSTVNQSSQNDLVSAILAEYNSLRMEVVSILDRQYSVAYWGISAVALVTTATIVSIDKIQLIPFLTLFIVTVVLPVLVTVFTLIWSHLITKLAKLGAHLFIIEDKLAAVLQNSESQPRIRDNTTTTKLEAGSQSSKRPIYYPISWEHELWNGHRHPNILKTIATVKWAILGVYALMTLSGGLILFLAADQAPNFLPLTAKLIATAVTGGIWLFVWFWLFSHVKSDIDTAERRLRTNSPFVSP